MKKAIKIILLVLAAVSAIITAAAVYMIITVKGDALLTMNSKLGAVIAAAYRPAAITSGILLLFWIIMIVCNLKRIKQRFKNLFKRKEKTKTSN